MVKISFLLPDDATLNEVHRISQEQDQPLELVKTGNQGTLRQILRTAPDRVHTILPGLVILNAVVKSYGVETISVSACGVREGYLLQRVMGVENHDE